MELIEEEKKAIEYIKEFKNEVFEGVGNKSIMAKNIDILLNLIDKQQKEIQRLEKDNDTLSELVIVNEDKVIKELDLISKDKIKKFIKDELPDDEEMELCTIVDVNGIELRKKLEELLEEN